MQETSIVLDISVLEERTICFPTAKVTTGYTMSAHAVQMLIVELT